MYSTPPPPLYDLTISPFGNPSVPKITVPEAPKAAEPMPDVPKLQLIDTDVVPEATNLVDHFKALRETQNPAGNWKQKTTTLPELHLEKTPAFRRYTWRWPEFLPFTKELHPDPAFGVLLNALHMGASIRVKGFNNKSVVATTEAAKLYSIYRQWADKRGETISSLNSVLTWATETSVLQYQAYPVISQPLVINSIPNAAMVGHIVSRYAPVLLEFPANLQLIGTAVSLGEWDSPTLDFVVTAVKELQPLEFQLTLAKSQKVNTNCGEYRMTIGELDRVIRTCGAVAFAIMQK